MNVSGPSLLLNRARVTGAGASRSLLAEGLARVPLTGLGLAPGELLVIPRHRSRAVLRTGADGAVEPGFGRSLGSELAATAATAMVDPLPGQHAAAYRFRSRASLAIWLLGTDVRPGGCADQPAAAALAAQLPGGSVLAWAQIGRAHV